MPLTRRELLVGGGSVLTTAASGASFGCSRPASDLPTAATPASWNARISDLETRVRQLMTTLRVPGVSVALIRDGRLAWKKSLGVRDTSTGVALDDETVFSAQSMSKPVFAYRVLKLWEQGVLDIDAPLSLYARDEFMRNEPRLHEITARRVLSHTTGLPNWRTREEPLRINFPPGTRWSYSGEGYYYLQSVVTGLVGRIDETRCATNDPNPRVCATDFSEYMEATLLHPFAMTRSGYVLSDALRQNLARPHDKDGIPLRQSLSTAVDVARYGSAGSLMTTASDYASFLIEVMQPKPADRYRLNERTRAEMLKPHIGAGSSPFKSSWALGWQRWHLEHGDVVAHGGDFDGWHSQSAFSPARKSGFVILTNGEGGLQMIWNELLNRLLRDFVFS